MARQSQPPAPDPPPPQDTPRWMCVDPAVSLPRPVPAPCGGCALGWTPCGGGVDGDHLPSSHPGTNQPADQDGCKPGHGMIYDLFLKNSQSTPSSGPSCQHWSGLDTHPAPPGRLAVSTAARPSCALTLGPRCGGRGGRGPVAGWAGLPPGVIRPADLYAGVSEQMDSAPPPPDQVLSKVLHMFLL
ncbi:unnamed protein product [Boreogadus saida]